jgi:hypothetical protein
MGFSHLRHGYRDNLFRSVHMFSDPLIACRNQIHLEAKQDLLVNTGIILEFHSLAHCYIGIDSGDVYIQRSQHSENIETNQFKLTIFSKKLCKQEIAAMHNPRVKSSVKIKMSKLIICNT